MKADYKGKPKEDLKINDKEKFESIFGTSADINFSKQYAIAVILQDAKSLAELVPVRLIKKDYSIVLNYAMDEASKDKSNVL